jgi:hypothetical protein
MSLAFRQKWITSTTEEKEPLLGTGDIQSLADLANGFEVPGAADFAAFPDHDSVI